MKQTYRPQGVCASRIEFEIIDGKIHGVAIFGGCTGNNKAVAALVEGMSATEAVKKLRGIQCRNGTSCADQLARAIEIYCA